MPSSFTGAMILEEFVSASRTAPERSGAWRSAEVYAEALREYKRRWWAEYRSDPGNRAADNERVRNYHRSPAVQNRRLKLDPKRRGRFGYQLLRHGPSCPCGTCRRSWEGWAHRIRPIAGKPS